MFCEKLHQKECTLSDDKNALCLMNFGQVVLKILIFEKVIPLFPYAFT